MTALLIAASVFGFGLAPDGWLLVRPIAAVAAADHLPAASLQVVAEKLWLTVRDRPAIRQGAAAAFVPGATDSGQSVLGDRRPRLVLDPAVIDIGFAAGHAPGIGNLSGLPVDTTSALWSALLEAGFALDLFEPLCAPEARSTLAARARATFTDVPETHRRAVFREAASAFLAHALSVAHEIGRHERRRRAQGKTLCGLFDRRASLFGLWQHNVFGSGRYTGLYPSADGWQRSGTALTVEDRRWLQAIVLGATWTGDPAVDFAWVCGE